MDEQNNVPAPQAAPTQPPVEPVTPPAPTPEPAPASVENVRPAGFTPKPKEEPKPAEEPAAPVVPETAAPKIAWKKPLITMAIIGVAAIAAMLLLK